MSTTAKRAEFKVQLAKLEKHRSEVAKPAGQRNAANLMPGKQRIKIRLRCKICGRARGVYRKFGVCRIHFRAMASDGLIPGVRKASW